MTPIVSQQATVQNGKIVTVTTRRPAFWRSWRHVAAYVYLFICIFDFVLMPAYYEFAHKAASDTTVIEEALKFAPAAQVTVLQMLHQGQTWSPLTLQQNGIFHVAFGAILGAAAFTTGTEKVARARMGLPDADSIEETHQEPVPQPSDDGNDVAPPDAAGVQDDHETEM
jgi:hypothetical protein